MNTRWRLIRHVALLALILALGLPALTHPPYVAAAGDTQDQWAQFRGRTFHVYRSGTAVMLDDATPNAGAVRTRNLGGVTSYGVAIATDRDDQQICVFAVGTDNAVYARCSWDGEGFDTWLSLGGLTYRGVVGFNLAGAAAVAATGQDGTSVWMKYRQNNGAWVDWYQPNGMHLPLGAHLNNNPASYRQGVENGFNLGPATISRVMMFNGIRNATPLVGCDALDELKARGAKTIIVRTSQGDDGPTLDAEMSAGLDCGLTLHAYIVDANRGASINWIIEVGNEPDVAGLNVYDARYWAIDARNRWYANWAGRTYNARLAASLPTERGNSSAPGGLGPGSYFDIFLNWNGDGRGAIRDLFDAYGVHAYSTGCLDRTDPSAIDHNYQALSIVDYTAAATNKPIYLTEMGVNLDGQSAYADLRTKRVEQGKRYVSALRRLSRAGNQVRGAMAFVQDSQNASFFGTYGIDADNTGGNWLQGWFGDFPQANTMGNRQSSAGCDSHTS